MISGRLGGTTYVNQTVNPTFNVTPNVGWTTYSFSFTASETGSQLPLVQTTLNCIGTCLVQDIDVIEQPQLPGNTTIYRDAYVKQLKSLSPGSIRFMTGADWCGNVADNEQPFGNNRNCAFGIFGLGAMQVPISWADELRLCSVVGADCFITVGQFNQTADFALIPPWLAANADYQALVTAGHKVYLEFGNETWNLGVQGGLWAGNGTTYGYFVGPNMAAFKAASGYDSAHMKLIADGWTVSGTTTGSWAYKTLNTASGTTNGLPDYIDNEGYTSNTIGNITLSGSDVATTNAPFVDGLTEIVNLSSHTIPTSPSTSYYANQQYAQSTFGVGSAIYEGDCAPDQGMALTQSQMDEIGGSVGCAMITIENMLLMQRDAGFTGPMNIFTLPQDFTNYFPVGIPTATITQTAVSGGVATITANNSYQANQNVTFTGATVQTALNSLASTQILSAGLSSTQFSVTCASCTTQAPTTDTGLAHGAGINKAVVPIWGAVRTNHCGPAEIASATCVDYLRPQTILMQALNNAIGTKTNMMNITQSWPTYSYAGGQNDGSGNTIAANAAAPYANAFAWSDGAGNYAVAVFNHNLTASESFTLSGTGVPSGSVSQTVFPGSGNVITDHNENTYIGPSSVAPVVGVPTPTTVSGVTYTVPAASVMILTYSASSTGSTITGVFSGGAVIH